MLKKFFDAISPQNIAKTLVSILAFAAAVNAKTIAKDSVENIDPNHKVVKRGIVPPGCSLACEAFCEDYEENLKNGERNLNHNMKKRGTVPPGCSLACSAFCSELEITL